LAWLNYPPEGGQPDQEIPAGLGRHRVYGDVRAFAEDFVQRDDPDRFVAQRRGIFHAIIWTILTLPAVWVVWAFLTRGGLSWRFAGIALVRRDGRPAARWQCAYRAMLVWVPVALLLLLVLQCEMSFYAQLLNAWEDPSYGMLWLTLTAQTLSLALLPVYVALALWQPTRAWHDQMAGVYLVPR